MYRLALFFLLFTIVGSAPLRGTLNAEAHDQGDSTVTVDNDVILTPGKGGHNFNAKSDSKGNAIVVIGGKVRGSVANRGGPEFNAKSKEGGTSQVRIAGDLELEGVAANAQKFNAVSESGGQSLVQVGNVQIVSGARRSRKVSIHTKPDREDLGAAWGAVAVADHNSRPWEDLESGSDGDPLGSVHVSELFEDDHNTVVVNPVSEIHDFPHGGNNSEVNEVGVIGEGAANLATTLQPVVVVPSTIEHENTNLNAVSTGLGSTSIVKVLGSVQI